MRTNRPSKVAEPRHRKTGPARLGGGTAGGKRARDIDEDETVEGPGSTDSDSQEDPPSWQPTRIAR